VANHCLNSTGYVNVIVSDKQKHLQYMTMDEAIGHCTRALASGEKPATTRARNRMCDSLRRRHHHQEALAAVVFLRGHFPKLKIRFVNVVDLCRLVLSSEHPHGLSDRDFDSLFTEDKPIIFNFHGYPWLVHRLTYRRTNHKNLHVRGYKEKGNINTPLDLAIQNQIDRFSLAIDVIDRVPALRVAGAHAKEALRNMQIECQNYAYEHGIDKPDPGSVDLARLGQVISAGLPVVFTSGQFMEGWRPVG
jgi:xylulose-5-phosphate/fructose-6-phosphate phosphoketolase